MKNFKSIIFLAALCFAASGCTVKQDISIKAEKNGDVFLYIDLHPVFVKYINDLSETAGTSSEVIFNTERIFETISDYPSVEPVSVISPESSKLSLILKVDDYSKILPGKYTPFLKISDSGEVRNVSFYIGKENYKAVDDLFMISENPVLSGLAPQIDKPYSKEEYVSLLEYVFADYLDDQDDAGKILDSSFVQLNIKTNGRIISSDIGSFKGNNLKVKIPVVDFLTLEKPVQFSFKYSL